MENEQKQNEVEQDKNQNQTAEENKKQKIEVEEKEGPPAEKEKMELLKRLLEEIQMDINNALTLMSDVEAPSKISGERNAISRARQLGKIIEEGAGKIIEGVFDGQNMVGPDGKKYSVIANYASKSKLVEGDILKLNILSDGTFVYKQIGPQKRARLRGLLVQDKETEEYRVLAEGKTYNVLTASVTYFKGEAGDDIIILVPESKNSVWAAVENIIRKGQGRDEGDKTASNQ